MKTLQKFYSKYESLIFGAITVVLFLGGTYFILGLMAASAALSEQLTR